MKLQANANLSTSTTITDIARLVTVALRELHKAVNGKLEFGVNVQGVVLTATFTAANSQITLAHNLGYTPTGYIQIGSKVGGIVYDGTTTNNVEMLYLKATVAGTYRLFIF